MIPRKIPWTTQPPPGTPLDMSHPMVQDLAFFCVLNSNGDQIDLVNNPRGKFMRDKVQFFAILGHMHVIEY